jgi:amino acid adenylation domain-containing protein
MLGQAGAKHLLYVDELDKLDDLIHGLEVEVIINVNSEDGDVPGKIHRKDTELPSLSGDDLAYLFFTSGTTGIPKGVLGLHKGLSHFLTWQRETFAIGPQDRCGQLTGLSFDVVLRDIFLPLTSGAALCLPERPDVVDHNLVIHWLGRENITTLHAVPSLAQSWLMDLTAEPPMYALHWTFFAGEPLSDTLVHNWRRAFPAAGIVNLYGPTETTLAKCFYFVPPNPLPGIQPVGQPLPCAQALILRESGVLCGIGEIGEIVIRTPFRALGYLNVQAEDRKRFVKNHFGSEEDDLLYHTGDLGRYRVDGSLEILGRLDHQVKIRGIRVEPDEVAAVLLRHSNVKACAVIGYSDDRSQGCLAAYVVLNVKNENVVSDLRAHLNKYLPSAMAPQSFEVLEALPLTANGKVDRRALPPPKKRSDLGPGYVAPRTPIEEELALLWRELLRVERVGIHDNFFELGGHSLLLAQLASRIRKAFDTEAPLRSLFDAPTIVGMSKAIVTAQVSNIGGGKSEEMLNQLKRLSAQEISALLAEK